MEKGQGSIEYLLIIGAAILVVGIVVISLVNLSGTGQEQIKQENIENVQNPLRNLIEEKKGSLILQDEKKIVTYLGSATTIGDLEEKMEKIEIETLDGNNDDSKQIKQNTPIVIIAKKEPGIIPEEINQNISPIENVVLLNKANLLIDYNGPDTNIENLKKEIKNITIKTPYGQTLSDNVPVKPTINLNKKLLLTFEGTGIVSNSLYNNFDFPPTLYENKIKFTPNAFNGGGVYFEENNNQLLQNIRVYTDLLCLKNENNQTCYYCDGILDANLMIDQTILPENHKLDLFGSAVDNYFISNTTSDVNLVRNNNFMQRDFNHAIPDTNLIFYRFN